MRATTTATIVAAAIAARRLAASRFARHADADAAGGLIGHHAMAANRVGPRALFRHALPAGHLALLLAHLAVAAGHVNLDRVAFANALRAAHLVLFPGGAGNPAANSPRRLAAAAFAAVAAGIAAGVAAAIAAMAATTLAQAAQQAATSATTTIATAAIATAIVAARNFTALPVPLVHAATNGPRRRLANPALLHDRSLFANGHVHAIAAGDRLAFRHPAIHGVAARPGFRIALAAVRGVALGPPLIAIRLTTTILGRRATVAGPCARGGSDRDQRGQQSNAKMMQDHAVSLFGSADPDWPGDSPATGSVIS